jgi:Glycosyl transferase family 8
MMSSPITHAASPTKSLPAAPAAQPSSSHHAPLVAFSHARRVHRYTKLRLWDMADEFDLLLYLDADTLALGKVEAALDTFAPNGRNASHPLGAVRDFIRGRATFNCGVMAVQPDKLVFREMVAEGRRIQAGRSRLRYRATYGEQAFLNAWLVVRHGWSELPAGVNLLYADYRGKGDKALFDRAFPTAVLLHYVSGRKPMSDVVRFDAARTRVVATSDPPRVDPIHAMWLDAWRETRRLLRLPIEQPGNATAAQVFADAAPVAAHPAPPQLHRVAARAARGGERARDASRQPAR